MVRREPDARRTSLIALAYLSCLGSQGSCIGGGRGCLFVIIPYIHGTSQMMCQEHVRTLTLRIWGSGVRISSGAPLRYRTGHAKTRRSYACSGDERTQQYAFRPHDAKFLG